MEEVMVLNDSFQEFIIHCQKRNIANKIKGKRYWEMKGEYDQKLKWWKEERRCIDWLYDHEMKFITSARLRNWMEKSIKFAKEDEVKRMQKYSDKKFYSPPQKKVTVMFDELEPAY